MIAVDFLVHSNTRGVDEMSTRHSIAPARRGSCI